MISKKITAGVMITLAAFSLAACQNSSKSSSTSSAPKSSQVKKTTLKASDLTAQQNASAITYYAAQTYGGRWKKTWNAAKKDGLVISFRNRNAFSFIDKGKGYVYHAAPKRKSSKTYYTIKGANASERVYFYEGKSYLGTQSLKGIVKEINQDKQVQQVKNLAKKTKISREAIDSGADNNSK